MKISINNFKSIGSMPNFEIKPFTILSGTNSSGKSSFIQLLLLLKQTLAAASTKQTLSLKGQFYNANNFLDLVKGKEASTKIEVKFSIDKEEFAAFGELVQKSIFDSFPTYECDFRIQYAFIENEIKIVEFEVSYLTEIKKEFLLIKYDNKNKLLIESNNPYFLKYDNETDDDSNKQLQNLEVNYVAFIPNSIEETFKKVNPEILDKEGNPTIDVEKSLININVDSVKSFLENYFSGLYYIGPLRKEPQDSYINNISADWVGVNGENTAQILERFKDKDIECNVPILDGDLIKFKLERTTLIEATNIWMCQIFKLGKKLYTKELSENFSIFLENENGIETTIKHVGFGISQILPIITQGLLMNTGETLILEQPEIHLHPKIQSSLFDFLYSLIFQGKNVIVETHSDHLITRLRRRIAEDENSNLNKLINLLFIEQVKGELVFNPIKLDDFGVYNIFPEDFIESPEIELKALLNAQFLKLKSNRNTL
jgi:predicted ATPase